VPCSWAAARPTASRSPRQPTGLAAPQPPTSPPPSGRSWKRCDRRWVQARSVATSERRPVRVHLPVRHPGGVRRAALRDRDCRSRRHHISGLAAASATTGSLFHATSSRPRTIARRRDTIDPDEPHLGVREDRGTQPPRVIRRMGRWEGRPRTGRDGWNCRAPLRRAQSGLMRRHVRAAHPRRRLTGAHWPRGQTPWSDGPPAGRAGRPWPRCRTRTRCQPCGQCR
jgi:hypothetical protein